MSDQEKNRPEPVSAEWIEKKKRDLAEGGAIAQSFVDLLARIDELRKSDVVIAVQIVELLDKTFANWRSTFN